MFCHEKHDNSSFCDPSTPAEQQVGDGCSCPYGGKTVAGKCVAAPAAYFCKHDAKGNACGKCSTDADCGGEKNACWGLKDSACPKDLRVPAPAGWCTQGSPKNKCQACTTEGDCNDHPDGKVWYCQKAKDPRCSA